jgi:EpsI family protein
LYRRRNLNRISSIALAVAALTLCYASVIRALAETWATSYLYSYGFAMVLISGYMLWAKSDRLRNLEPLPDYFFGVPVVLAGVGMLAVGRLALLISVQELSLLVALAGFVLLLFGREAFACIWFPLGYLLFGIPIWDNVIGSLQPPSQDLSARMATSFLQVGGIPVLREGTTIVLPNVTLEVMRECSGVNQLLAIVTMSLSAAYLWLRSPVKRATLVGFAVVVAYLSNGVRIALVGFLAYRGLSNGDLRGLHLLEGLAVSVSGYLLLFGFLSILSKGERDLERAQASSATTDTRTPSVQHSWLELGTCIIVLVIGAAPWLFQPENVRLSSDLGTFPNRIGAWTIDTARAANTDKFPAIDDELVHAYPGPTGEHHFAALDDELVRTYQDSAGQRVRLYIGYHRSQREGKELAGDAGHLLNVVATPVSIPFGTGAVELRQVQQSLTNSARGLLYCYVINGRMLSSLYLAKRYMVWDALTRRRSNAAVVMVAWESDSNADAETSRTKAAEFAQAILPLLPKFIPS